MSLRILLCKLKNEPNRFSVQKKQVQLSMSSLNETDSCAITDVLIQTSCLKLRTEKQAHGKD